MDYLKSIKNNHEPLVVTSSEGDFVVIARDDFEALDTTNYLLKSPGNVLHLAEAKKLYNEGKGEIIKDEEDLQKYVEDL